MSPLQLGRKLPWLGPTCTNLRKRLKLVARYQGRTDRSLYI